MIDDELDKLENALTRRQTPLDPALKLRVLECVKRERSKPDSRCVKPNGFWRFALTAAAVALVMLNVSLFAANHTVWSFSPRLDGQDLAKRMSDIRELLPEISDEDARRLLKPKQNAPRLKHTQDAGWPTLPGLPLNRNFDWGE
jgi:hypothetical protein